MKTTPTQSHPAEMAHTPHDFSNEGCEIFASLRISSYIRRAHVATCYEIDEKTRNVSGFIVTACNSYHAQQAAIRQLREALGATMQTALIHGAIEQEFGPALAALESTNELVP